MKRKRFKLEKLTNNSYVKDGTNTIIMDNGKQGGGFAVRFRSIFEKGDRLQFTALLQKQKGRVS